ncbi:dephospho-CoA kinase [Antarcticibacterium flavum]|uniref:Dephospho-CoA kinase n=1 Tax=Antarcticibacterium flavum TaxID=2058175 RepID=A0A5B7X614_9FLAO|nr:MULTISPECIES: dephospho-CoA kinase [Antarcticibacterium]MCM4161057.1 dephospho-CoA kinase [Antarcticibacterium sp. W02-3]QCY70515.1 dephospho-CoA kinase [Antarcticibacterium flavum]
MKVIGLTGGIGSGKTTVAGFFKELGIPVYIADEAGKTLLETNEAVRSSVIKLLGPGAYTGNIPNRKYIASRVFSSPEDLEKLNNIIHPAVAAHFEKWKQEQDAPYVIYEAAILFETGGHKKCDAVILVTATMEERLARLQKRDSSTVEEIEARMKHQWSDPKKLELANFEIKNNDLASTRAQVRNLHEILLKPSKNWGLLC